MIGLLLTLTAAHATTFVHAAPVTDLAARSAGVVHGTVVDTHTLDTWRGLVTEYTIAVDEALAGDVADEVTIQLPGGHHNGMTQQFQGVPLWDTGDEVIVFVPEEGEPVSLQGVFSVQDTRLVDQLAELVR